MNEMNHKSCLKKILLFITFQQCDGQPMTHFKPFYRFMAIFLRMLKQQQQQQNQNE